MLIRKGRTYVPVKRSMQSALQFFGIDDRWHPNAGRQYGFWTRHEDDLEMFAHEVRAAVRSRLKEVRTDFVENHEQAVLVTEVYEWLKRQFQKRGVRL